MKMINEKWWRGAGWGGANVNFTRFTHKLMNFFKKYLSTLHSELLYIDFAYLSAKTVQSMKKRTRQIFDSFTKNANKSDRADKSAKTKTLSVISVALRCCLTGLTGLTSGVVIP